MAQAFQGFEAVGVRHLVVVFEQERADNAQRLGRVKEQLDRMR